MLDNIIERVPPHSVEAEQMVLASMLVDPEAAELVRDVLKPESFYRKTHGALFSAIVALSREGKTADLTTVRDHLDTHCIDLSEIGGFGYLVDLAGMIPTTALVEEYAGIVAQKAGQRQLIRSGSEIVGIGFNGTRPIEELVGEAQAKLAGIEGGSNGKAIFSAAEVAQSFYDGIQARAEGSLETELEPLSTGFYDLDQIIEFDPQDLIILAARPAMGKTSLALNLTTAIAQNHPTLFATMEMSKEQLMLRVVASYADVDAKRLKRGDLTEAEWNRVAKATRWVAGLHLQMDERAALTIGQLRASCRRAKLAMGGLRFIVVDYLQLMTPDNLKASRNDGIGQVSNGLKALAKEFGCPVLALSQLSRALESRDDKIPHLSDLRDSGSIEQDADSVMFIYRPEYYFKGDPTKERPEREGEADIIIAKQRKGPVGKAILRFDKDKTRFSDRTFNAALGR